LQGNCFEPDRSFPYAPFLDLLRKFCASAPPGRVAKAFGPTAAAQAQTMAWLAQVWGVAGVYGRALDLAAQALNLAESVGHRQFTAILRCVLGVLHLDLLAWAAAQTHLEIASALARESQAVHWVRTAAGWLASALAGQGQLTQAQRVLDAALPPATPMRFLGQRRAWAALAELRLAQGQAGDALAIAEQLLAATPQSGEHGEHAIPRLGSLRGAALAALGRYAEADAALRGACDVAGRHGARGLEWRTRAARARLYHAVGQVEAAEREAALSRDVIEACAASLDEAALREAFLRQATAALPAPRPLSPRQIEKKHFGGLTAREREVALRVAQGQSNRAIADDLVLSERTVEKHVENILAKLGFDSRAQIAAWVVEKRLGDGQSGDQK
jgi:DNA-binding CsgD family transcriptional regulator